MRLAPIRASWTNASSLVSRLGPWCSTGHPPVGALYTGEIRLFGEALVQAVDQVGHRLEALRYDAQPIFAEMLRIDPEGVGERLHDVVRRHRPVSVHQVVEVAGREPSSR